MRLRAYVESCTVHTKVNKQPKSEEKEKKRPIVRMLWYAVSKCIYYILYHTIHCNICILVVLCMHIIIVVNII